VVSRSGSQRKWGRVGLVAVDHLAGAGQLPLSVNAFGPNIAIPDGTDTPLLHALEDLPAGDRTEPAVIVVHRGGRTSG
jgi:hypothetical protein